jgi:hypothetical protein
MSMFLKVYTGYSFLFGIYGFSRGIRVEDTDSLTEKVISGTVVFTFYAIPVINIIPTIRLVNRITLKKLYQKIYISGMTMRNLILKK